MLFLNNFSLMNSIKEELILHIMWTVTFLLVTCKFINNENRKNKTKQSTIPGHCILDGLYKHYLGVWQVGQGSHIAYLLGKVIVSNK